MLMQLCLLEPGCGSFTLFIFSVSGSGQDERADVHQGGEGWGSDVGRRGSLVIGFVLFHLLTLTLGVCAPHTEGSTFNPLPKKRDRPWVRTLWWPDITDFMEWKWMDINESWKRKKFNWNWHICVIQAFQRASLKARDVDGQDEEVLGGSCEVWSQHLPCLCNQCSKACLQTCGKYPFHWKNMVWLQMSSVDLEKEILADRLIDASYNHPNINIWYKVRCFSETVTPPFSRLGASGCQSSCTSCNFRLRCEMVTE